MFCLKFAMTIVRRSLRAIFALIRIVWTLIRAQKLVFGLGFCIGITLALLVHLLKNPDHVLSHFHLVGLSSVPLSQLNIQKTISYFEAKYDFAYENWLSRNYNGAQSEQVDPDLRRFTTNLTEMSPKFLKLVENSHKSENMSQMIDNYVNEKSWIDPRTEAYFLYQTIPVICIVYPTELDWTTAIKDTWGKHCNQVKFFSHKIENSSLEIELVKASSEFSLICQSLQSIWYENVKLANQEGQQNFWIMISTQDTFVLMENLRFYVAPLNQSGEYYLGHAMKFWNSVYNWADAGYAISYSTLKRFVEEKFPDVTSCEAGGQHWKNGDWYLGRHLKELGIKPVDTRDQAGRGRFNGHSLKKLLFPGGVSLFERYWRDSLYLSSDGPHCCSNFAVTFHGIQSKTKIYQLYYLYYHLLPFHGGGSHGNSPAPPSHRDAKAPALTWDEHLKNEALAKLFDHRLNLMTTPKNLVDIMKSSML